jgi:hypothetical protein
MIKMSKIKMLSILTIVAMLFTIVPVAMAGTINDVNDNSLMVGKDVYQLNDTEGYNFDNVVDSIGTGDNIYFKWGGKWFDMVDGSVKSLDDLNDPAKAITPSIDLRYWYKAGNTKEDFEPASINVSDIFATKKLGDFKFTTSVATTTEDLTGKIKANGDNVTEILPRGDGTDLTAWKATIPGAAYDTDYAITFEAPFTAQAATVKWAAPVVLPTIESIAATNSTTIQVSFATGADIDDTKLAGKTINLTAGEVSLTATYVASSLASGKANFSLATSQTLVDATNYTVSADWANITAPSFVAKTVAAYTKTFEKVTTEVRAGSFSATTPTAIYFSAKNQYGDVIAANAQNGANVKVDATYNGLPLNTTEAVLSYDSNLAKVAIGRTLAKDATLAITLTKYDKDISAADKVALGSSSFTYIIVEGQAAVPTSIARIVATKAGQSVTSVAAGDSITLTADVRDQYNNPCNSNVRWVITLGANLVTVGDSTTPGAVTTVDNNGVLTVTAKTGGSFSVDAYNIANGAKATYSVTIGATPLNGFSAQPTFLSANNYNQENIKSTKIAANAGAILTADMLKFKITAKTTGTTEQDIQVTAATRGGSDPATANDILLTVKTAKAGTYEIIPYVGTSFTDEKVVKANMISLTTTLNPDVTEVVVDGTTVQANETVVIPISFKNKHGEVIPAKVGDNNNTTFISSRMVAIPAKDANGVAATTGEAISHIKITAGAVKGTYPLTVSSGDSAKVVDVIIVEQSKVKTIEIANSVTVICNDTYNDKADSSIFYSNDKAYKIMPITFKDQNAGAKSVIGTANVTTSGAGIETVNLAIDANTGKYEVATTDSAIKAVAVRATTTGALSFTVDVANDYRASEYANRTVSVTSTSARAPKTIAVDTSAATLVIGATKDVIITLKDQYEKPIDGQSVNVNIDNALIASAGNVTGVQGQSGQYKVTLTALAQGSVTVSYSAGKSNSVQTVLTVKTESQALSAIKISTAKLKSLYSTATTGTAIVSMAAEGQDANGQSIPVDQSKLTWTVDKLTIAGKTTPEVNAGLYLTTSGAALIAQQPFKGTAVIKVTTQLGYTDTCSVNFDCADPTYASGTLKYYTQDAKTKAWAEVTKDKIPAIFSDASKNSISFAVAAKDQYDGEFRTFVPVAEVETILGASTTDGAITVGTTAVNVRIVTITGKGAVGTSALIIRSNNSTGTIADTIVFEAANDLVISGVKSALEAVANSNINLLVNGSTVTVTATSTGAIGLISVTFPIDVVVSNVVATISGTNVDIGPYLTNLGISLPWEINAKTQVRETVDSDFATLKAIANTVTLKINGVAYTVNLQ